MQLKRDTDYALRLWLCIFKSKSEMTLVELCKATAVPKTIALRLCQRLLEANLLSVTGDGDTGSSYFISPSAANMTLFDLIQAVEGSCKLFAVFDQTNAQYSCCNRSSKSYSIGDRAAAP